jgi:hypothetical protein
MNKAIPNKSSPCSSHLPLILLLVVFKSGRSRNLRPCGAPDALRLARQGRPQGLCFRPARPSQRLPHLHRMPRPAEKGRHRGLLPSILHSQSFPFHHCCFIPSPSRSQLHYHLLPLVLFLTTDPTPFAMPSIYVWISSRQLPLSASLISQRRSSPSSLIRISHLPTRRRFNSSIKSVLYVQAPRAREGTRARTDRMSASTLRIDPAGCVHGAA